MQRGVNRNEVVRYVGVASADQNAVRRKPDQASVLDEMRERQRIPRGRDGNTDRIMRDTFWVGVYPGMTDEMIDYMAKVLIEAAENSRKRGVNGDGDSRKDL